MIFQRWFDLRARSLKQGRQTSRSLIPRIFEKDVLPIVGSRPIHETRRHDLPAAEFAKMAGKSRRWINNEIEAGNLLAISVGNRGMRVPDWHLHPLRHALVQAVLKLARGADPGRIYDALALPRALLHGDSAIAGVTAGNFDPLVSGRAGHPERWHAAIATRGLTPCRQPHPRGMGKAVIRPVQPSGGDDSLTVSVPCRRCPADARKSA